MEAFSKLHDVATEDGALSLKEKELIAVGISVVVKCMECIQHHVKVAIAIKAMEQFLAE